METADSVIPTILSATLDYSTGVLVVTSNEFIDTTGIDQVDVDQLYLSNGNDFITWTVTIDEQSLTKGQGVAVAQASNSGTLTVAWTGGLGTTIVITSAADQVFDTAADLIVGGTQINAANLVSVSSTTTNGQFHIHLTGSSVVANGLDSHNVTVTLTELQRVAAIAISNTPGGDGSAVVLEPLFNST